MMLAKGDENLSVQMVEIGRTSIAISLAPRSLIPIGFGPRTVRKLERGRLQQSHHSFAVNYPSFPLQ